MDLKRTGMLSAKVDNWRLSSHADLLADLVELESGVSKALANMTEEELEKELKDNEMLYDEDDRGCQCGLQQGTEHEGFHHPECEDFDGHN